LLTQCSRNSREAITSSRDLFPSLKPSRNSPSLRKYYTMGKLVDKKMSLRNFAKDYCHLKMEKAK